MSWLACPRCGDVYDNDPSYQGPLDDYGFGVSTELCLDCWETTESDDSDELQVSAVRSEAPRSVPGDDDGGGDDYTDDGEGDGDDGPDDCGGDDFTDYYHKWSEYERTHRFDSPVND